MGRGVGPFAQMGSGLNPESQEAFRPHCAPASPSVKRLTASRFAVRTETHRTFLERALKETVVILVIIRTGSFDVAT